jgi:hypothetical protein
MMITPGLDAVVGALALVTDPDEMEDLGDHGSRPLQKCARETSRSCGQV